MVRYAIQNAKKTATVIMMTDGTTCRLQKPNIALYGRNNTGKLYVKFKKASIQKDKKLLESGACILHNAQLI